MHRSQQSIDCNPWQRLAQQCLTEGGPAPRSLLKKSVGSRGPRNRQSRAPKNSGNLAFRGRACPCWGRIDTQRRPSKPLLTLLQQAPRRRSCKLLLRLCRNAPRAVPARVHPVRQETLHSHASRLAAEPVRTTQSGHIPLATASRPSMSFLALQPIRLSSKASWTRPITLDHVLREPQEIVP